MKNIDEKVDFYYGLIRKELSNLGVELVNEFDKKTLNCSPREVFLFLEQVREREVSSLVLEDLVTKFYWDCL